VLCKIECLAQPSTSLFIVASHPQKAHVKQTLPLHDAILGVPGNVQGLLIIPARTFKLAQRFIGLSSCSMEFR
jgi:hypothetical protein